jgi:hypothetical protein
MQFQLQSDLLGFQFKAGVPQLFALTAFPRLGKQALDAAGMALILIERLIEIRNYFDIFLNSIFVAFVYLAQLATSVLVSQPNTFGVGYEFSHL